MEFRGSRSLFSSGSQVHGNSLEPSGAQQQYNRHFGVPLRLCLKTRLRAEPFT